MVGGDVPGAPPPPKNKERLGCPKRAIF